VSPLASETAGLVEAGVGQRGSRGVVPTPQQTLGQEVVQLCLDAGFAAAGIATLEPVERQSAFTHWIDQGKHGDMNWLAETLEARCDPHSLLPGATAAVMVADLYSDRQSGSVDGDSQEQHARIARYAQGHDYHTTLKKRLHKICDVLNAQHPQSRTRSFVDTAPVHERELASRAGLGWIGKHTLTIHPRLGSWFVLGGFFTTLPIAPPLNQTLQTDHCGTCTRCIDACPTNAISPYSVDATRCISYLTIEHRGPIQNDLSSSIGHWFAGCDICQEVCPHNSPRNSPRTSRQADQSLGATDGTHQPSVRAGFDIAEVLGWDEATRRARFAKSALKRIGLAQAHRNAAINAGHALEHGTLSPPQARMVREALCDLAWNAKADPLARDAARSALLRVEQIEADLHS
jgi:epoxyqueuosine reductase